MRKMLNKLTGGEMWVADNRVEEYKAAGHVLAADSDAEKPVMNKPEAEESEEEPEEPKKEPARKPAAKRRKR